MLFLSAVSPVQFAASSDPYSVHCLRPTGSADGEGGFFVLLLKPTAPLE